MERALNGRSLAVVVNRDVVLGVVRPDDLGSDPKQPVGEVMDEAPPTIRADVAIEELAPRLQDLGVESVLVTTPQGQLIGLVRRSDPTT